MLGVQLVTRPSAFVRPVNLGVEAVLVVVVGCRVWVTGMLGPGRPRVVSRTWQVIGGFFSGVDIFGAGVVGGERWFVRAEMRCVVDMRVWRVGGVAKMSMCAYSL